MFIPAQELKHYISAHRSCNFVSDGCLLKPRNSKLSLDFSLIDYDCLCILQFKRRSGNGRMIIKSNGEANPIVAKSLNVQGIQAELDEEKRLDILRVADCSGDLLLCGIDVVKQETQPPVPNQDPIEMVPEMDWNAIVKACGGGKGFKLSGDNLFASEGAVLNRADRVISVETEPQNVVQKSGKKLKFVYPCQVLSIVARGSKELENSKYIHLHNIATVSVMDNKSIPISNETSTIAVRTENIYDSKDLDLYNCVHDRRGLRKSGSSILMTRCGSFCVSMPHLSPNMLYTFVLAAKKTNGNGKISLSLLNAYGEVDSTTDIVAPLNGQEAYAKLSTSDVKGKRVLQVHRTQNAAVGEVLIHRIQAIHATPVLPPPDVKLNINHATETPEIIKPTLHKINYYSNKVNRDICEVFKNHAILHSNQYDKMQIHKDLSCPILVNGSGATRWFNKISPIFPNINNSTKSTIAICSVPYLVQAKVLWIEEFDHNVNANHLRLASNSSAIYTPSLTNMYVLKRYFPNKNIQLRYRPWPILFPAKKNKDEYFIYLEKDPQVTQLLLNLWKKKYGKLCVVGTRQHISDGIDYVSEYEPYEVLYDKIASANAIIDISPNSHYISGVLELAKALGLVLITNNHKYIADTPFIIRNSRGDGKYYMRAADIDRVIRRSIGDNIKRNYREYNIKNLVAKMLEIKC